MNKEYENTKEDYTEEDVKIDLSEEELNEMILNAAARNFHVCMSDCEIDIE